ncbi:MAG: glycine cleavage system aminomethyltransferase GcvT [Myxococcota bacterium]|nr:glycine cleavage system aminomethyltransferase GcvT [Myxococcota bacterium]
MKRTPLYNRHEAAGARFVDFGGWEMPVRYTTTIQAEHQSVRTSAGLFDVSHMGEIEVSGENAVDALNRLVTNDLSRIHDGQACYTAMCLPSGGIVDDLVIYRYSETKLLICCNAANREKDYAWICENLEDAVAVDRGDEFAQLALQGPKAASILQTLTEQNLADIKRYWFVDALVCGVQTIVSRTGYTGEDGFELYCPSDKGEILWDALFEAGGESLKPIGLGARDTLRLEMKYALYGNDIDETTTPLEAGLGWITKLDGGDFIGKDVLLEQKETGVERRLVAFKMSGRAIARKGYEVVDDVGNAIGRVTSGTRSPTLGENIGLAYVPFGAHRIGSEIKISVRNRIELGTIVKPPFVKPGSDV